MNWRLTTIELAALILAFTLAGCATTDSGRTADRAVHADLASTGIALVANEYAVEANPLALPLVPLRYWINQWADDLPCGDRNQVHGATTIFSAGYAASNLGAAAALSWHPYLAIPGALFGYWRYRESRCTQDLSGSSPPAIHRPTTEPATGGFFYG